MAESHKLDKEDEEKYKVPENIWKILGKQLAYLSGTVKCEHDVVCIPEGVAQASKQANFVNDFESTLQFLKYCIQRRESLSGRKTVMVLVQVKNMSESKLRDLLKRIESTFQENGHITCKAKNTPKKDCPAVHYVKKQSEFASVVGGELYIPKEFGGKLAYSSSQHKQWIKFRQDLEDLRKSTERTVASVQAATEGMKPNYSHGSLSKVKQLLAEHIKDKVGVFDSLYTLNEQIPEMKRSLKAAKGISATTDWSTMVLEVNELSHRVKESEAGYQQKAAEHKMWLEWRVSCLAFVDGITKLKDYFTQFANSFDVSTDELENKEKLVHCVHRSKLTLEKMKEFSIGDTDQLGHLCMNHFLFKLKEFNLRRFPLISKNWAEETRVLLTNQLDGFSKACLSLVSAAKEKIELMEKAVSIHKFFFEVQRWSLESNKALSAACAYDGQNKVERQTILDSLVQQAESQPVLSADVLDKHERLTELFSVRVQEAKLDKQQVVDRLNKQLKAWGHSMEATDGGGLGPVYQELLDGEERYVRELEVIVEGYLKTVQDGPMDLAIPVRMKQNPQDFFGNAADLYHFHRMKFLPKLKQAGCNPKKISGVFSDAVGKMEAYYSSYCKNYENNKDLIKGSQAQREFEMEMEIRLKNVEPLPQLLSIPCTRLNIYKQHLITMVKLASNQASRNELQIPVTLLTKVLLAVNRAVSDKYGKTLLDDVMKVRLSKTRRFRATFKDRHVVLYESALAICRTSEQAAKNKKSQVQEKAVFMQSDLCLPAVVPGSRHQFTISKFVGDKKDVILIDAGSVAKCTLWMEQLQKFASCSPTNLPVAEPQNIPLHKSLPPVLPLPPAVPQGQVNKSKSSLWPLKRGARSLDVAENKTTHPTKLSATWSAVAALNQVPSTNQQHGGGGKNPASDDTDTGYEGDSYDDTSDEEDTSKEIKDPENKAVLYTVVEGYTRNEGEYPIAVTVGEVVEVSDSCNGYLLIRRLIGNNDNGWVPQECLQPM